MSRFHTKKYIAVFCVVLPDVSYSGLKIEVNKEKIRYILQFFFDKDEKSSQATAEIVNGGFGAEIVTANFM